MQKVIKILVVLLLLATYPVVRFIAHNFLIESSKEIYEYIPQESDVVIEVNSRNFLKEAGYQRIFNEDYFNAKINPDPEEEVADPLKLGIDFFSRIMLFRENWSEENIWIAVMKYNDEAKFRSVMEQEVPNSKLFFDDSYALVQLTPSQNQEQLDEHIDNILHKKIKPITAKINVDEHFNPEREINCYFSPEGTQGSSQIIDGFLSFEFKKDDIKIEGNFTPAAGLDKDNRIAYALDEDAPFSLRSSLNIFNSIYWFGKERVSGAPEYTQMAIDYHGLNMFVVNPDYGYDFPFKSFPDFQLHFDIEKSEIWHAFFDSLQSKGIFRVDTTTSQIITQQGAYFKYKINDKEFDLMRQKIELVPSAEDDKTCFVVHMNIDPLIDNTKMSVDENQPPDMLLRNVLIGAGEEILEELRVMANIERIHFRMTHKSESEIEAEGEVVMKEKNGNAIIEGLFFGKGALLFIKDYFTQAETGPR